MSDRAPSDTCLVIRAYDEASRLGAVLTEVVAAGYAAVVVDDGSTDRTPEVVRAHPVTLVRHLVNLGPGAALQTGLEAALATGAHFLVTFDADGQHSIADVPRLLEPLRSGTADVVFGSRFLRAEDRRLVPFGRRTLLGGARLVNFLFTGRLLTDAHNGLRALSAETARGIRLRETSFAYASELLAIVVRERWRLVEVPVSIRYTEESLAKGQKGWNAIDVLLDLLGGRLLR